MSYVHNIEEESLANTNFRKVLYTDQNLQLVVMSLLPQEEIGEETHNDLDQFIRVEAGVGKAVLEGIEHPLRDGDVVIVPKGTLHNIINTSAELPLKLYTIYAPPQHPDGKIHATKAEADADEHDHI